MLCNTSITLILIGNIVEFMTLKYKYSFPFVENAPAGTSESISVQIPPVGVRMNLVDLSKTAKVP